MIVREVRLENIKSYGSPAEVIRLARGVNAISGQNGSGKSTVLEAIGAAIFQHLPYRHEIFVREGESTGTITVVVESRLDGRTYEIVRRVGRGATHYAYDVELAQQIAKGEADVGKWLRQHLGVETDVDLKTLFVDTVGPPQGTLTAAFLDSAQVRRAKFNRLLRVEEYEDAYRKLSALESALDAEERALALAIKELEVQTRGRADLELRRDARRYEQADLGRKLSRLVAEEDALDVVLRAYEAASNRWNVARASLELAQVQERNAASIAGRAREEVTSARLAATTCRDTRAARDTFLTVERDLRAEDERREARDRLRDAGHQLDLRAARLRTELDRLDGEIRRGEEAVRRIAALEALIPAQDAAEIRVAAAVAAAREVESLRQRLDEIKGRGTRASERVNRAEKAVAAASALAATAAQLPTRRERYAALARELAAVIRAEGELSALVKAAQEESRRIEDYCQRMKLVDEKRSFAEERGRYAIALELLEARYHEISVKRATAESRLTHAMETRAQVTGGVCPFLLEPCKNLRPGRTLEAHFDDETHHWRHLVEQLHFEHAESDRDLQTARASEKARLAAEQLQREGERIALDRKAAEERYQDICLRRDAARTLAAKRVGLARDEPAAAVAVREAEHAATEVARVGELQAELEDARLELGQFREEWRTTSRKVSESGEVEGELKAATTAAEAIGRPREEVAHHRADADRLLDARAKQGQVQADGEVMRAERAAIESKLTDYANVDARIGELHSARDTLRPLYEQYVAALPLAERLAARTADLDLAELALTSASAATRLAQDECDRASAAYDPADHQASQARRAQLSGDVGQTRAQLELASQDEDRLNHELAALGLLERDLEAARQRAGKLAADRELASSIRLAIRATGPEMTRRLLGSISRLATSINGEILNQGGVEVEWIGDYEIVTRRNGETRGFAQLSGGEQMAAALAVRMAAMRLLSNVRVAFLDEPTAHLDQSRRANLGDQVQRLQGFDQLVVISHDDTFDGLFGHVVRVDKRDGRSRVVDEA